MFKVTEDSKGTGEKKETNSKPRSINKIKQSLQL